MKLYSPVRQILSAVHHVEMHRNASGIIRRELAATGVVSVEKHLLVHYSVR